MWDLFILLHHARQVGLQANPIPIADIIAILEFFRFDQEIKQEYLKLLVRLDAEWLKWREEEQGTVKGQGDANSSSSN